MRIFESLYDIPSGDRGSVVVFGVFDGVHIGHAKIISTCVKEAQKHSSRSIIITFKRHPRAVLKKSAPEFLMTLDTRLEHIAALGVRDCLLLDFNERLSATEAEEFLRHFIIEPFGPVAIVVGCAQRFGRDGAGSADTVKKLSGKYNYHAIEAQQVQYAGSPVSSSRIRKSISDGFLEAAATMLGRKYVIEGSIKDCDVSRVGTFACLDIHHEARPKEGRYEAILKTSGGNLTVGAHMVPEAEDIEIFIPELARDLSEEKHVYLQLNKRL